MSKQGVTQRDGVIQSWVEGGFGVCLRNLRVSSVSKESREGGGERGRLKGVGSGKSSRHAAVSWDLTGGEEPQAVCEQGRAVGRSQVSEDNCCEGTEWRRMDSPCPGGGRLVLRGCHKQVGGWPGKAVKTDTPVSLYL